MSGDPARVHYFTRQFLRTQDFTDEQAYHLALHRRHNVGQHSWGIVAGLDLMAEGGSLWVGPGAAVDGYGRDVVLPECLSVPEAAFAEKDTDALAVFLAYDRVEGDPAPAGYDGCGDGGAIPFYRWLERPRLVLLRADPDADPRRPDTVPLADAGFGPSRTPPDDPDDDWPVYLGTVTRDITKPAQPYTFDIAGRPYAGLVGSEIVAPSQQGRILLDADPDEADYRFGVYLTGSEQPVLGVSHPKAGKGEEIHVHAPATLDGALTLAGHAVEFQALPAEPADGPKWGIYRVEDAAKGTGQLRIEMAGAAATGQHQVVIGSWNADTEKFEPALTVDANGDVTVHGDLVVRGGISEQQTMIGAELPAAVKDLAMAGFLSGIGGASALLDRFYRSPSEDAPGPLLRAAPDDRAVLRTAAALVATDEAHLAELAEMLVQDPDLAARMRTALET